jgi:hypothetical protein
MENITYKNYDVLSTLPTDKIPPTPSELQILNTLFNHKKEINNILSEAKEAIIVGIIFLLFSVPQLDSLIQKFIPITEKSTYILLLIKILFVIVLFWVVKHFYLIKK